MSAPRRHSPAPWVLNKSGVSVDAGATRIRMEASADREELKANAALIAAAPELLAALTSRCAFHDLPLDGAYHIGSDAHGERRYTCQLTTAERAVIARAEGRS